MTLLITTFAAIIATMKWYTSKDDSLKVGTLALIYWGAALMWSVDCVQSFREGEGLFDLSGGDAALGGLILACAAFLYAVLRFRERRALR